ncbi:hypothetical protein ACT9XH_09405 [Methanococcoides methylutens]|uniref:hypothetical protein n=1 Tax=Methanococcoides methylutens TaxID=2226 RepID=UPI0040447658
MTKDFHQHVIFILMLPLAAALIYQRFEPISAFGVPAILLMYYAYNTENGPIAAIAGIALIPLYLVYTYLILIIPDGIPAFLLLFDPVNNLIYLIGTAPYSAMNGLIGYLTATRKPAYLMIAAILFGICLLYLSFIYPMFIEWLVATRG